MTPTKIKMILEEKYGISNSFDRWLKLPQISVIHLNQDANIYINDNSLYYFNSDENTLCISTSYFHKNLKDSDINSSFNSYTVSTRFTLDSITGFIATVVAGPYGTYINRRF